MLLIPYMRVHLAAKASISLCKSSRAVFIWSSNNRWRNCRVLRARLSLCQSPAIRNRQGLLVPQQTTLDNLPRDLRAFETYMMTTSLFKCQGECPRKAAVHTRRPADSARTHQASRWANTRSSQADCPATHGGHGPHRRTLRQHGRVNLCICQYLYNTAMPQCQPPHKQLHTSTGNTLFACRARICG